MTEVVRYGLIAKEDLSIGTGTIEARLADGRVVTLTQIRLTDFLSALTLGSVLFVKATGIAGEDNSNLFWDDTNNRLGVGTASPSQPLHVVGIILTEANLTFQSGTSFVGTLDHAITAARTWTLPDSTDTIALIALAQTLTNKTILAPSNTISGVLDRDVTVAEVVNTITETTVYSFSVPGGTLGSTNGLRLSLVGDYLNNSVGTDSWTVIISYGGTNVASFGLTAALAANASRRPWKLDFLLFAANATGTQNASGHWIVGGAGGAGGSVASAVAVADQRIVVNNAHTKDSTVAQTLAVTITHATADAQISARLLLAGLEVLR